MKRAANYTVTPEAFDRAMKEIVGRCADHDCALYVADQLGHKASAARKPTSMEHHSVDTRDLRAFAREECREIAADVRCLLAYIISDSSIEASDIISKGFLIPLDHPVFGYEGFRLFLMDARAPYVLDVCNEGMEGDFLHFHRVRDEVTGVSYWTHPLAKGPLTRWLLKPRREQTPSSLPL